MREQIAQLKTDIQREQIRLTQQRFAVNLQFARFLIELLNVRRLLGKS